ncbi:MAG: ribulose bisphosphate carboxylase small subunit, partial [Thiohalorhabdaceae bacterium]
MAYSDTVQDYRTKETLGTFGFLPQLSQEKIYDHIENIIAQG